MFCVVALLLTGCRSAEVANPLTETTSGNETAAQMEFFHTLAERKITSNDEAFHALLLFLDGADPADTYKGRVAVLKERGMLGNGFDQPANQAISRGTFARAICVALEIKGGLTMRLAGPQPRYAMLELQDMNLFPAGSVNQTFTGNEILTLIGKAEDYQRDHANVERVKTGD